MNNIPCTILNLPNVPTGSIVVRRRNNLLAMPNVPINRITAITDYMDFIQNLENYILNLNKFSEIVFESDLRISGRNNPNRKILYDNTKFLIKELIMILNIFNGKKANVTNRNFQYHLDYIQSKKILLEKCENINKLLVKWKPNIQQICISMNELIELCRSCYTMTYKITE
jgi:hypothetical protein